LSETELRKLVAAVKAGRMSRRAFVRKLGAFGLTAPLATQLLARAGLAQGPTQIDYKPDRAGGGGALKLLFWQGASLLNPHFTVGAKDSEGCRIFYEPLAAWDPDGNLVPVLAAEIPSLELKSVIASVYFSSDVANPDTASKFYCDLQMHAVILRQPDPGAFMRQFVSSEIASKNNKWQGRNVARWRNDEYDRAFHAAEVELDPVQRAALIIKMNDLIVEDCTVIPIVNRRWVAVMSRKLKATLSGWDNDFWNLKDWYRET
jgi:ABC-type transport system substrate-binding protein